MDKSDHEFRELLERYLNGTATPGEREILEQFFKSYEPDATEQENIRDETRVRDRLLRKIHERVDKPNKNRRLIMAFWLPLAAAIAFFVVAIFFTYLQDRSSQPDTPQAVVVHDSTGRGQRTVKVLPDGSTAYLNSQTTITYPERFGSVREVSLHGEAFFEVVSNGKPFVVRSGEVMTRVVGTSFNVRHREKSDTEITLVEGKVNVTSADGKSLDLIPGEQAVVGDSMTKRVVNVMLYAGWKDNILFFEQTTFGDAIREIEEWYAVEIEVANPELERCTITAKYQNEPLGNVLSSLEFLLGLTIKRLDDYNFLVDGNGCK